MAEHNPHWTLHEIDGGRSWEIGPVSRGELETGEAIYKFPWPEPPMPEMGEKYLMEHENGDETKVHLFDDLMGSIWAGKIG